MKKTQNGISSDNILTTDTAGLCDILGTGRYTATEIGEKAGARIKVGKRVLWNVPKIQAYLDSISE